MTDLIPASRRPSVAFFSTICGQVLKIDLLDYQMSICGQCKYIAIFGQYEYIATILLGLSTIMM